MSDTIDITKICEWCRKEFIAHKCSTRFCSKRCSERAYKALRRQRPVEENNAATQYKAKEANAGNGRYLTPYQCATLLGISRVTLYRYLAKVQIPCIQFNSKTLIGRASMTICLRTRLNISRGRRRLNPLRRSLKSSA